MKECLGEGNGGLQKGCLLCLAGVPTRRMVQVLERNERGFPTGRYWMADEAVLEKAVGKKGAGK